MCPKYPNVARRTPRFAKHLHGLREVEARRRRREGPVADEEDDEEGADERQARRREQGPAPRTAEDGVHEIREALAERESAHEDAEREAAARAEPGGENLHPRRIDAREPEARQKAQRERGSRAVGEQRERRVRGRAEEARPDHELPRRKDVRQVEDGARERAGDEAQLDREREPRRRGIRQAPLRLQERRDRRRREPERHPEQLGERKQDEDAPAPRRLSRRGRAAHPAAGITLPGFRIPFGSSACLIARIAATNAGGRRIGSRSRRVRPTPCSPVIVPPRRTASP